MDNHEIANIKAILQDDKYQSLLIRAKELIDEWNEMKCIGDNEFDTLKLTLMREFKVQGLKEYLDILEQIAYA
jgi:hypothetical protein